LSGNGPVVVNLDPARNGDKACVKSDLAVVKDQANPAGFYVNLHTSDCPKGAIRGQLAKA